MIPPSGPVPARIMLVGEAPGEQEVLARRPFVGSSGHLLDQLLHEAQILRTECFITNVCRERPPGNDIYEWMSEPRKKCPDGMVPMRDRFVREVIVAGWQLLAREIDMVQPNVIVAFGNVAMWALTGRWGIKNWRGSTLTTSGIHLSGPDRKVIPLFHPAYILRDWSVKAITSVDFKRVRKEMQSPEITRTRYNFILRPSLDTALHEIFKVLLELARGPMKLSVDIETRSGHIACLGVATSRTNAFCIPFMCVERPEGYWLEEEEHAVVLALKTLLTHSNARVVGQNFIYDTQYIYKHWGFVPRFHRDTMLGHHSCFSGLPKGLGYLSSMYAEQHIYWKDEGKTWDRGVGEEQLWAYNCKDCCVTYEVDDEIQSTVDKLGLRETSDFQQSMFWPALQTMTRGVRVDIDQRSELALELSTEISNREEWFKSILGHPLNPKSPLQMKKLFYDDLKQSPILSRKKSSAGNVTLDDEALKRIAEREPILRPLLRRIAEFRSLNVFLSTFITARLGHDKRLRCGYNIAGTETYRLSSSKDAFGSGLNLQNIPAGGVAEPGDNPLELPNVRKLFIPDPGYTFFDGDLDRADLQVVVWEADDAEMKAQLREGIDLHTENAKVIFGVRQCTPQQRQMAKRWVHGTNYVGSARTMAIHCGLSVHQSETMQARWFGAHPGIKAWHKRVEHELATRRYVENKFGYRRYYFDRIDGVLSEAVAWTPQSTVAIVINHIWMRVYHELPEVQVLLQVHDSLAGQIPSHLAPYYSSKIEQIAREVVVPYSDPLVIPFSIKMSAESWGGCK